MDNKEKPRCFTMREGSARDTPAASLAEDSEASENPNSFYHNKATVIGHRARSLA